MNTPCQTTIVPVQKKHLAQIEPLVNLHLSTLIPGWALSERYIADHLQRNPGEYVIDPWVIERVTLCALVRQRVVAVAHLLRYGTMPEVNPDFHNTGEIAWFLALPEYGETVHHLLEACHRQFAAWQVAPNYRAWHTGLPIGPFVNVPTVWLHIIAYLEQAGYRPAPGNAESVYSARLEQVPAPTDPPPLAGLALQRSTGVTTGARFSALLDGQVVGYCEIATNLTAGDVLPSLYGWGELSEVYVEEPWRRQGIATWLIKHAVAWHRMGGGKSVLLSVSEAEEPVIGDLYKLLGWQLLVRQPGGWERRPDRTRSLK